MGKNVYICCDTVSSGRKAKKNIAAADRLIGLLEKRGISASRTNTDAQKLVLMANRARQLRRSAVRKDFAAFTQTHDKQDVSAVLTGVLRTDMPKAMRGCRRMSGKNLVCAADCIAAGFGGGEVSIEDTHTHEKLLRTDAWLTVAKRVVATLSTTVGVVIAALAIMLVVLVAEISNEFAHSQPHNAQNQTEWVGSYKYRLRNNEVTLVEYRGPGGEVEISNSYYSKPVIGIEYRAFSSCGDLTGIVIHYNLKWINDYAFAGCGKLCVTFADDVTHIPYGLLSGMKNVSQVIIPDSVTSIGYKALENTELTSIDLPQSIENIGGYAFAGCRKLTSVTLPDGLTEIQSGLFSGCEKLKEVIIPDSVTAIRYNAFKNTGLTSIVLPKSVESIGAYAFADCRRLTSVTLPRGMTEIQTGLFMGCRKLEEVIIPNGVTAIGSNAFSGCSALSSITLPGSVETISADAFYGCTAQISAPREPAEYGLSADEFANRWTVTA